MTVAVIRCTCPMCHRKDYYEATEWLADHQGHDVRHHEARLVVPDKATHLIYTGEHHGEQVLVQVWPRDFTAQLAYRHHAGETWGVPTTLKASE